MTCKELALWHQVESFSIYSSHANEVFIRRLARENRWSARYAARVFAEYKRFMFIAAVAGHPVSPPETVDQAWHLHLIFTRSYWNDFCGEILGKPFHHEPNLGEPGAKAKFDDWYAQTVNSYQTYFGEAPPRDIWPAPALPKATQSKGWLTGWRVSSQRAAIALVIALFWCCSTLQAQGQAGGNAPPPQAFKAIPWWNPLEWTGPDFLKLLAVAIPLGLVSSFLIRRSLRLSGAASLDPPKLSDYELAYLAGGNTRVEQTAIYSLVHQKKLDATSSTTELRALVPANPTDDPLERAILSETQNGSTLSRIKLATASVTSRIAEKLVESELLATARQRVTTAIVAGLPLVLLNALMISKLALGTQRGKPVAILVLIEVFFAIFTLICLIIWTKIPMRTRKGDEAISQAHERAARERTSPAPALNETSSTFAGNQTSAATGVAPIALALGGISVLHASEYAMLRQRLGQAQADGSSGCGGTGCGGGGGGGCGGGGCGGCSS